MIRVQNSIIDEKNANLKSVQHSHSWLGVRGSPSLFPLPARARIQEGTCSTNVPFAGIMNIGIDLGTTNSGLAYVQQQPGDLADYPEIRILNIPQYVTQNQIEPRR